MAINPMTYHPAGDKKNSSFFNEYRLRIYDWRHSSGLDHLLQHMRAIVIQIESGDALGYLNELYIMTPYRFSVAYRNKTHNIYILNNLHGKNLPWYIILEPLDINYQDEITQFDSLYPIGTIKSNARYIGEIFQTKNMHKTREILESHDIRFHEKGVGKNEFYNNSHFVFTEPSPYTFNRYGYTHNELCDFDNLQIGEQIELPEEIKITLALTDDYFKEKGLDKILLGVDHLATRILSSNREDAILEFLTCSNYYFWGAYNISEENSSTNVNRHPNIDNERLSPAKVFTANNIPYFLNSFENTPMPTENFVRNLGPRMHHIAQDVLDGDHNTGVKNIDYAVQAIKYQDIKFLAHIVGGCKDKPDLKQIFSKRSKHSMLITEYVERCHGFQGFFSKGNVAALTNAAGQDEIISKKNT
ncbi:MAG TPA: hypothetical protein QF753_18305 [Victivallales bacterium]|nr:hypothetical protein [Victivallales bacterium]